MRPKGWENPYIDERYVQEPLVVEGAIYEAGADAYEEGLKKEAIHIYTAKGWEYLRESYEEWLHGNKPGYIVFIEE